MFPSRPLCARIKDLGFVSLLGIWGHSKSVERTLTRPWNHASPKLIEPCLRVSNSVNHRIRACSEPSSCPLLANPVHRNSARSVPSSPCENQGLAITIFRPSHPIFQSIALEISSNDNNFGPPLPFSYKLTINGINGVSISARRGLRLVHRPFRTPVKRAVSPLRGFCSDGIGR